MNLSVVNPNFSIVAPVGCNAKCSFCFWENKNPLPKTEYLSRLKSVLGFLPNDFYQCSITGGEPTLLAHLECILEIVRPRFSKVVLSTNGTALRPKIYDYIDHLNISRHDIDDKRNAAIFGTDTIPCKERLSNICHGANSAGIDVTLNCVLPGDFTGREYIYDYIQFAKEVNASRVCFRKALSDLEILPVEAELPYAITGENECPVCRSTTRLIHGMETWWKYGIMEPSIGMGGVYELIFHPGGELTTDWKGEVPVDINEARLREIIKEVLVEVLGDAGRDKPSIKEKAPKDETPHLDPKFKRGTPSPAGCSPSRGC